MTLSIRLHSILCRSESDENSDSDEPYVLVTTVKRPQGKTPADVRTIQHGPWEMDDGDVIEPVSARAIWDTNGRPADIMNPDDVIIIVTVVENDQGSPGGIRTLVQSTATATMAAAVTAARQVQVARLLQDLPGAVTAADVGFLGDDHVGTRELRLTPADLAANGIRFKVLEIDGGDDGSYQLTFRLEELHRYEFAATAHLAAVTRDRDRMEVWAADGNGVLVGNPFEGRWHGWYERPGVPLVPASNLAALSRDQYHMEVWAVGTDSTVHGVFFQHGWRDWYPLPGVWVNPGAPLAAVSRDPDKMEVWCIDVDGTLWGIPFESGHWAEHWYPLPLPDGERFLPGTPLTAISRAPNLMEVWAVDQQGMARGIFYDGTGWGHWYVLGGATFTPATRLTVISRYADHMEILGVDAKGLPQARHFDGNWAPAWYPIPNAGFTPGQAMAGVSRDSDLMEVWAVGYQDGIMRGNWWADGKWQGWYPLIDGPLIDPGAHIAAVSRSRGPTWSPLPLGFEPQRMEFWTVGANGVVAGDHFDGTWRDWYPLEWSWSA